MLSLDATELAQFCSSSRSNLPDGKHWAAPWSEGVPRLVEDSRDAKAGDLFVAIKGSAFDGHAMVPELLKAGVYAVVEDSALAINGTLLVRDTHEWLARATYALAGSPGKDLRIFGITGTNGKTSTAWILHKLLQQSDLRAGLCGTIGSWVGRKEQQVSSLTTPSATQLSQFAQTLLDTGAANMVMEVSSHAICQQRIVGLPYYAAAFLNLSPEHLDYHGSMESYYAVKAGFMKATETTVRLVLRIGDGGKRLANELGDRCITAGLDEQDRWQLEELRTRDWAQELRICGPDGTETYDVPLAGAHNAWNALVAIALARESGMSYAQIVEALRTLEGIPGRLECIFRAGKPRVIIDYAHTPDGYAHCLKSIQELHKGRIICVFGCGGDRDRSKRAPMVQIAAKYADELIMCLDNPRTEDPAQIFSDMEKGLSGDTCWTRIDDRGAAITGAIQGASQADLVLLLGKGHERYQLIGKNRIAFDERTIVQEAFDA